LKSQFDSASEFQKLTKNVRATSFLKTSYNPLSEGFLYRDIHSCICPRCGFVKENPFKSAAFGENDFTCTKCGLLIKLFAVGGKLYLSTSESPQRESEHELLLKEEENKRISIKTAYIEALTKVITTLTVLH